MYEATSYWDKDRKQSRNKQICIGRLDPATGDLIPSKRLLPQEVAVRAPAITASAEIVGPSIILDVFTERLGLDKLLKSRFPREYRQILTMAYYLISRGGPLSNCEWQKYLGSVEAILKQYEQNLAPVPAETDLFEAGVAALMKIVKQLGLIELIDEIVPKREQGPSVGQYMVLAALNRILTLLAKPRLAIGITALSCSGSGDFHQMYLAARDIGIIWV